MRIPEKSETIQVPGDVEVSLDGRKVTVKGLKGTLIRDFSHEPVSIELDGKTIKIWAEWPRKRESALVGTISSHIQNMITGVTKGFTYKLKVVFSHFPISVKLKEKTVLVENFTGERSPTKGQDNRRCQSENPRRRRHSPRNKPRRRESNCSQRRTRHKGQAKGPSNIPRWTLRF